MTRPRTKPLRRGRPLAASRAAAYRPHPMTTTPSTDATRLLPVRRHPPGDLHDDPVVVEEPLEIRVDGDPLAVLMRTPGRDRDLAAGFLLTEGVIDGPDDLTALAPCADPNRPHAANVLLATLAAGCTLSAWRRDQARRAQAATASCGVCGKATLDSIYQRTTPHPAFATLPRALLADMGARARAAQPVFDQTGGLHAAALFGPGPDHALLAVAEDVGRHNAVDKVVGARLLADALPDPSAALWVSGRASFELVQKVAVAGFGALVCVGAPTTLAVDLAQALRVTLVGFARASGRFNVYAGAIGD